MTPNTQSNPWDRRTKQRHHTSIFQTLFKVIVIRTTWYWHKNKHKDQRNWIKSPELNLHTCVPSCFSRVQIWWNPMDHIPPGSSVHGILQARILGCHALLQGIFPTQGLNAWLLCLLQWQASSLLLAPPGKPESMCIWSTNIQ